MCCFVQQGGGLGGTGKFRGVRDGKRLDEERSLTDMGHDVDDEVK